MVGTLAGSALLYASLGQLPAAIYGRPLVSFTWLQLVFITCPLAIAAAILRYRLFDIELIVKRSIVYGILGVALVIIYLLILAPLSQWLPAHSEFIALVAGGVAALVFRPVHDRIQRFVSRLVYGSRDDPFEVVSRISHLDQDVQPSVMLTQLTETLVGTLRLSYAAIQWARPDGSRETAASTGIPRGTVTELALARGKQTVGWLLLDVKPGREPFGPSDHLLLDGVRRYVSHVADVILLNRALQRSRERLVSAREEERRRLHRDLHDGIGPSLAAQAMQIDVARTILPHDPNGADEVLAAIAQGTQAVIGEIRRVVDDLRPPALDQLGLVSALEAKVTSFNTHHLSSQLSVHVEAKGDFAHLPAATEVAAYRIATEALANVARHARANQCDIGLVASNGTLLISVADDGVGIPATYDPGVGIESMRERASELGGTFELTGRSPRGTRLVASLPIGEKHAEHDR